MERVRTEERQEENLRSGTRTSGVYYEVTPAYDLQRTGAPALNQSVLRSLPPDNSKKISFNGAASHYHTRQRPLSGDRSFYHHQKDSNLGSKEEKEDDDLTHTVEYFPLKIRHSADQKPASEIPVLPPSAHSPQKYRSHSKRPVEATMSSSALLSQSNERSSPAVIHVQNNVYIPKFSMNKFKEPIIRVAGTNPAMANISTEINPTHISSCRRSEILSSDRRKTLYDGALANILSSPDGDVYGLELYPYSEGRFKVLKERHREKKEAQRLKNLVDGFPVKPAPGKASRALRGVVEYLCTPLGLFMTIHSLCLGLGTVTLILLIAGVFKFPDPHQAGLAIEICTQLLVALSSIFGLGLLPSRLGNLKDIMILLRYSMKIRSSPAGFLLKKNRTSGRQKVDKNDLLGILRAYREHQQVVNFESASHCNENEYDDGMILDDIELFRIKKAMEHLNRTQPWYNPLPTKSQRAFSIFGAFFIIFFFLVSSIGHGFLCYFMWTMSPRARPVVALMACGASLVSSGVATSFLIWRLVARTKKGIPKSGPGLIKSGEEEEGNDEIEKLKNDENEGGRSVYQGGNYIPGGESVEFMNRVRNHEQQNLAGAESHQ